MRRQVSKEANAALLNLQPYAEQPVKVEVGPVLAIISRELRSEQEPTRLEALRWCVSRPLGFACCVVMRLLPVDIEQHLGMLKNLCMPRGAALVRELGCETNVTRLLHRQQQVRLLISRPTCTRHVNTLLAAWVGSAVPRTARSVIPDHALASLCSCHIVPTRALAACEGSSTSAEKQAETPKPYMQGCLCLQQRYEMLL
jgi:hypothetical protein